MGLGGRALGAALLVLAEAEAAVDRAGHVHHEDDPVAVHLLHDAPEELPHPGVGLSLLFQLPREGVELVGDGPREPHLADGVPRQVHGVLIEDPLYGGAVLSLQAGVGQRLQPVHPLDREEPRAREELLQRRQQQVVGQRHAADDHLALIAVGRPLQAPNHLPDEALRRAAVPAEIGELLQPLFAGGALEPRLELGRHEGHVTVVLQELDYPRLDRPEAHGGAGVVLAEGHLDQLISHWHGRTSIAVGRSSRQADLELLRPSGQLIMPPSRSRCPPSPRRPQGDRTVPDAITKSWIKSITCGVGPQRR